MKKITGFLVLGLLVCSSAFAMARTSPYNPDSYEGCVVNAAPKCGSGTVNWNDKVAGDKVRECTAKEQKACFDKYKAPQSTTVIIPASGESSVNRPN